MANRYWVGGTGTWNNTSTTNWSATSGGASGASAPTSVDNVFFDANSGTAATVTVASTAACNICTFNKSDLNLSLSGNVSFTDTIDFAAGTITLNNNKLTLSRFLSSYTATRTVAFGTGDITLTGNNITIWNVASATGFAHTGTPTVNCTYSGATGTRTIDQGSSGAPATEANSVSFNITAGTDTVTFASSSFNGFRSINFTGFAGTLTNTVRTIYGNLTLGSGMTITDGSNATTFASASGTQTITSNGRTFSAPTNIGSATAFPTVELADALNLGARNIIVVAGTFDTKGYNVTCASVSISGTSAYTKTIKLNNSTVTLSGVIAFANRNNFTFDAGTSSIVFTGTTGNIQQYYGPPCTFYNVSFTSAAVTSMSLLFSPSVTTFNNLSFPAATTTSYGIFVSGNIKVNGTLTLPTGSSYINRVWFYSFAGTTINAAAISGTLTDVDFRGITVTGPTAPWTGTRLGNGGGNSGITGFETPKTVYWSLAAGGNWSATAWATSSGGTPAVANYPILGDTVIFDNAGLNTSATVTADRSFAVNNVDYSARSNAMTFTANVGFVASNGNFTASSSVAFSGTATLYVGGWSGTSTLTSATRTFSNTLRCSAGPNATLIFADNYTSSTQLQVYSGNVDLNGKTFATSTLGSLIAVNAVINLSGSTFNMPGTSPFQFLVGNGGFGYKTFTGTCTFNCSSASAKTVNNSAMVDLSGFTFVNTGAGALTFSNTVVPGFNDGQYGTYGDIQTTVRPATINFTAGDTFQFNNFTISGTSGNLVTLQSSLAGTRATLLSPNVVNSVSFCSIKDLNAINTMGYGEWRAYTTNGNVDAGNNTGWLFSPATPSTAPRPTIRLRSLAQRGNMT